MSPWYYDLLALNWKTLPTWLDLWAVLCVVISGVCILARYIDWEDWGIE